MRVSVFVAYVAAALILAAAVAAPVAATSAFGAPSRIEPFQVGVFNALVISLASLLVDWPKCLALPGPSAFATCTFADVSPGEPLDSRWQDAALCRSKATLRRILGEFSRKAL